MSLSQPTVPPTCLMFSRLNRPQLFRAGGKDKAKFVQLWTDRGEPRKK